MKQKKIGISIIISFALLCSVFLTASQVSAANYNDWTIIDGVKYFFNSLGQQIGTPGAKRVIDVSQHQGNINWASVKNDNKGAFSIDGAILRLGYGSAAEDAQLANNLNGVRSQGIPFGTYLYSYANDTAGATEEAKFVESLVRKYGLENTNYPIYYDIERFDPYNSGGGKVYPPTSVAQYEEIITTFIAYLKSVGINNVQVYSYTSYINERLNSPKILPYLGWIAEYNHNLKFDNTSYNGFFGWQYWSEERVNGIVGNVDINCFYDKTPNAVVPGPPEEVLDVPEEISALIKSQGLGYGNTHIGAFSLKPENQASTAEMIRNMNNGNYTVILTDSAGNSIDYSSTVALKTGDLINFKRKDPNNTALSERQFAVAVRGDINGNGRVDAADYLMVMDNILGKFTMSKVQTVAGDINSNTRIDAADYLMIMDNILGKYSIK